MKLKALLLLAAVFVANHGMAQTAEASQRLTILSELGNSTVYEFNYPSVSCSGQPTVLSAALVAWTPGEREEEDSIESVHIYSHATIGSDDERPTTKGLSKELTALQVLPRADIPLGKDKDGNQLSDVEYDDIGLSNELVSHVLEFKCAHPKSTFEGLGKRFFHEIRRANKKLEKIGAMLLPTACHPFMDPAEMQLWPYDCLDIYQTYDRIFNCKGHGWANLQSTHLNLSFDGDDEFGKLHAAIRLLLPLIPAIAASSPYLDGKYTGFKDARIEVYRHNQDKVPEIAGLVIPEKAYTYDEYNREIFDKVKKAIAPYDP